MIAVDANILVYAHRAESEWHGRARASIERLAEGLEPWAIPWPCVHEFYSTVTHPRIFAKPTPRAIALDQIDIWFESPTLVMLSESEIHWVTLRGLIVAGKVVGPKAHDARIAALCVQHRASCLLTADRDFSAFPSLKKINPLVSDSF
jgi:uncharacterized protein